MLSLHKVMPKLANEGNVAEVLRLFLEAVQPDVVTLNILLKAHRVAHRSGHECERVLNELCDRGIAPNLISYSTVLQAYANEGLAPEAERMLSTLRQRGLRPSIMTYTTLLSAYCHEPQPPNALERVNEIIDELRADGLQADEAVAVAAGRAFTLANDPDGLLQLIDRLTQSGFRPRDCLLFNNAIRMLQGQEGRKLDALDVIDTMRKLRVRMNHVSHSLGLQLASEIGDSRLAQDFFNALCNSGAQVTTASYNQLLKAYVRDDSLDQAMEVVRELMPRHSVTPDRITFATLFRYLATQEGTSRLVLQLMDDMQRLGIAYETTTFNALAAAFARERSGSSLVHLLQVGMPEAAVAPNYTTFRIVFQSLARQGDVEGILRLSTDQALLPKAAECGFSSLLMHRALVRAQCVSCDAVGAERVLEHALSSMPLTPSNNKLYTHMFHEVAEAYAKMGHIAEALDMLRRMVDLGIKPWASVLSEVVLACRLANQPDKAWLMVSKIYPGSGITVPRAVLWHAAMSFAESQNANGVRQVLELSRTLGYTKPHEQVHMFDALIKAYAEQNELAQHLDAVLDEMRQLGIEPNNRMRARIAHYLVEQGLIDQAVALVQQAEPGPRRFGGYAVVVDALCHESEFDRALDLVCQSTELCDADLYLKVLRALLDERLTPKQERRIKRLLEHLSNAMPETVQPNVPLHENDLFGTLLVTAYRSSGLLVLLEQLSVLIRTGAIEALPGEQQPTNGNNHEPMRLESKRCTQLVRLAIRRQASDLISTLLAHMEREGIQAELELFEEYISHLASKQQFQQVQQVIEHELPKHGLHASSTMLVHLARKAAESKKHSTR